MAVLINPAEPLMDSDDHTLRIEKIRAARDIVLLLVNICSSETTQLGIEACALNRAAMALLTREFDGVEQSTIAGTSEVGCPARAAYVRDAITKMETEKKAPSGAGYAIGPNSVSAEEWEQAIRSRWDNRWSSSVTSSLPDKCYRCGKPLPHAPYLTQVSASRIEKTCSIECHGSYAPQPDFVKD